MAKPKLCLIPASQGSKVFSVLPSDGSGDFDFSRSGKATRINSQGLIETVSNGQSRLNYPLIDGKVVGCPHHILEPQRTNSVTYSEVFTSNTTNVGYTATDNNTISPDGSLNGAKILESTGSTHLTQKTTAVSSTTDKYTASFFVKSNGRNKGKIAYGLDGAPYNSVSLDFDLKNKTTSNLNASGTGASVVDSSFKDYGNGWFHISITGVVGVAGTHYCRLQGLDDNGNASYTGDVSKGFFIFGFQLEQGSYPTSYIPTNGEANGVTRAAETANGSGDSATFSDSEGVLMVETSSLITTESGNERYISISGNGSTNNSIRLGYNGGTNTIYARIRIGGTWYTPITNTSTTITDINKLAVKWKVDDFSLWVNGFESTPITTSGNIFGSGDLTVIQFNRGDGSEPFYGNTKQLQYYNSALTDSELEELTSWDSFKVMAQSQLYSVY